MCRRTGKTQTWPSSPCRREHDVWRAAPMGQGRTDEQARGAGSIQDASVDERARACRHWSSGAPCDGAGGSPRARARRRRRAANHHPEYVPPTVPTWQTFVSGPPSTPSRSTTSNAGWTRCRSRRASALGACADRRPAHDRRARGRRERPRRPDARGGDLCRPRQGPRGHGEHQRRRRGDRPVPGSPCDHRPGALGGHPGPRREQRGRGRRRHARDRLDRPAPIVDQRRHGLAAGPGGCRRQRHPRRAPGVRAGRGRLR